VDEKLSEMSLKELWQLFPIYLTEHKPGWSKDYDSEIKVLKELLPAYDVKRFSHIGSTAIEGIWAKPIIDILVELVPGCDMQHKKGMLTTNGYICMSEVSGRMSFNKGYTENGFAEKVFHLHLRNAGDNDELYFRDYLNEYPVIAKQYEKLKLELWKQYEHNRDEYTEKKTDFITATTKKAKEEFRAKYS